MGKVIIPYKPRPFQWEIHKGLDRCRWGVIVAHRRFGKTVCMINHLVRAAVRSAKELPQFGYLFPQYKQAKLVAWRLLKKYTRDIPNVKYNETDLFAELSNTAIIRLFGTDNPDSLRGAYFDGVVLDEVGQIDPYVWGSVIRPMLSDRAGWAAFIGTPKGMNQLYDLYFNDKTDWFKAMYKVTDTKIFSEAEIADLQKTMSETEFRQEYMCDFGASTEDSLIPLDEITSSQEGIDPFAQVRSAVCIGVDVARFGDDRTVICCREGRMVTRVDAYQKKDNMEVVSLIIQTLKETQSLYGYEIFIDGGRGEGVIDRLRELGYPVQQVDFGGKPVLYPGRYGNRRAELWGIMRDWIRDGGVLPNNEDLIRDLSVPKYFYNKAGKIMLESKDKIKSSGNRSPDMADALALTFGSSKAPGSINVINAQVQDRAITKPKIFNLESRCC